MISSLETFLIIISFVAPIYWLCAGRLSILRTPLLIAASLIMLLALSPVLPLVVFAYFSVMGAVWQSYRQGWIGKEVFKTLSWLMFAPLLIIEFVPAESVVVWSLGADVTRSPDAVRWAYLGLSYMALRSFLSLRQALARNAFRPVATLATLTFFGSFAAGPIAGSTPFTNEHRAPALSMDNAIVAMCRIGWGMALLLVVAPAITAYAGPALVGAAAGWFSVYRNFLGLYLNFAGYTDIAIGTALLFGVSLPENFKFPLLARSVQEFWQRWHLSLAALIGQYLFKPMVRHNGRPALAITITFALVGLWHDVSWTYLIWGMGHGSALAVQMIVQRRMPVITSVPVKTAISIAGWAATMTYVAVLSAIANSSSLAQAGRLGRTLLGA